MDTDKDIIERLAAASIAVGMTKKNADTCVMAAEVIRMMRTKPADPNIANLRCLESSVKHLIACLCRHDGSVLRDHHNTDGTISGDLYAIVATLVGNRWDNDTLSDLQRRYPMPKPIDAASAGNDGSRELPDVPREVSDGGGSAERGGVCGSADEQPALTAEQQELCELFDSEFPDKSGLAMQIEAARPLSVKARKVTAEQFEADLLSIINAAKERNTYTADMVQAMLLHCHSAAGTLDSALEPPPAWMQEALEQARSTTRRNILHILKTGLIPPLTPREDMVVADTALQLAKPPVTRDIDDLERQLLDAVLRGAIKNRDNRIMKLQAEVNQLARHIAFGAALGR